MTPERARRYAGWLIGYGQQYAVDPLLLGALMAHRSRCDPHHEARDGEGLFGISPRMHRAAVASGRYRFWRSEGSYWRLHERVIDRFPFSGRSLRQPEASIYFAAALLSVYRDQCQELDVAFGSRPHRHHVSHFVFGDRVPGTWHEDWVLQERRRLLQLYSDDQVKTVESRLLALASPLDGAPRRISSAYRTPRAGGRRHRGVDFYSTWGEPVRAVADGVVSFAGVQPRGRGAIALAPSRTRSWPRRRTGIGGLFVLIAHARQLHSGYFHLSQFVVRQGARVRAGQIIGHVGRTGIRSSPSHLHFELRLRGRNVDPTPYLRPHLIWPGKQRHQRPVS